MDFTFYYDLICKQPLLTKEQEQKLIATYKDESNPSKLRKAAADKIIQANLRFVFKKAKMRSKGDPNQFEELISAGNEGLLVALDKFDHHSGYRFLTYAGFWVLQRMLKEQSRMRLVALPIWKQQLGSRIQKVQDASPHKLSAKEIHDLMPQESLKDIQELLDTRYLTFYFEDLGNDNFYCEKFLDDLVEELDNETLLEALASLSPFESTVLRLSFGFDDGEEKSPSVVAKLLGRKGVEVKEALESGSEKLKAFFKAKEKPESLFD